MDLRGFAVALLSDVVSLLSGAVGLVLTIVGFYRTPAQQRKLFWAAALLCMMLSSARVWTTEHTEALSQKAELRRLQHPDLTCSIDQTAVGTVPTDSTGDAIVVIIAKLSNLGAPSSVANYSLRVRFATESQEAVHVTVPERLPIAFPNGFRRELSAANALYNKTVIPVAHNAFIRGYLLFRVRGKSQQQLESEVRKYELSMQDITGTRVSCERQPDDSGPNTVLDFAGLDQ